MSHPVTIFTGQWADFLAELARIASLAMMVWNWHAGATTLDVFNTPKIRTARLSWQYWLRAA